MKRIFGVLFFISFNLFSIFGQQRAIDSLQNIVDKSQNDSVKVKKLIEISQIIEDTASTMKFMKKALEVANKSGSEYSIAFTEARFGYYFMFVSTDYPKATYWTNRAMKRYRENNIEAGIAQCDQQLGLISVAFEDYSTAINYFEDAAEINSKLNNFPGLITNYEMLGLVYMKGAHLDSALINYRKAQKVCIRQKKHTHVLYVNMTGCFLKMNEIDSAEKYVELTDSSYKSIHNTYGIGWVNMLRGEVELAREQPAKAISFLKLAYDTSSKNHDDELLMQVLPILITAYGKVGNYKDGYLAQSVFIKMGDSINGHTKSTAVFAIQKKFEEDQIAEIQKLKEEKIKTEHEDELQNRNRVIWATGILLVIVSLFGFIVMRGYRQKQKANIEISRQKEIVEEKQKEILDSIHYAKRIQSAVLPTEKYIEKSLKKLK